MIRIIFSGESAYDRAYEKAQNPRMSVANNPLRDNDREPPHVEKNMDRLQEDACMWNNRRHGEAYRAIRGMVYGSSD